MSFPLFLWLFCPLGLVLKGSCLFSVPCGHQEHPRGPSSSNMLGKSMALQSALNDGCKHAAPWKKLKSLCSCDCAV